MKSRLIHLSVPLVLLALAGCSSHPASDVSPDPSGAIVTDSHVVAVGDHVIKSIDLDTKGKRRDPEGPIDPGGLPIQRTVYFELDSFTVKPEYQSSLQQHARYLTKHAQIILLIQGSADERGSREYNLALGQKRAEAIKKSLALMGVSERQVEAVSIGEEQPVCTEPEEACWARNRKGELIYSRQ